MIFLSKNNSLNKIKWLQLFGTGYIIYLCLNLGLWLKIDASRRRNDPRNPVKDWGSWCGLDVSLTYGSILGELWDVHGYNS